MTKKQIILLVTLSLGVITYAIDRVDAATATISSTPSQTIKGWGCFPSRGDTSSDDQGALWNSPAAQTAIYNSGFTVMRTVLLPGLYSRGTTLGTMVIDDNYLNKLKHNVQIAVDHGITTWTLHPWSPPPSMKCNNSTIAGALNPAFEQIFCDYYTAVLLALQKTGLPLPTFISVENEPYLDSSCSTTAAWDTSGFTDAAQYIRVVKTLRATLNANGLSGVKIFGPETSTYFESITTEFGGGNFLGGPDFSFLADADYNKAIAAYAFHSYDTDFSEVVAAGIARHPKDVWMTEWSLPQGTTEMDWTINTIRHLVADLVDVPVNYWYWWDGWSNVDRAPDKEELITVNPTFNFSKRYFALQKLWTTVRPGWVVKKMTTTDPDLKTVGVGNPEALADMMAFEPASGSQSFVVLCNWTVMDKPLTVNGLKGSNYNAYGTWSTTDMKLIKSNQPISGGSASITLPAYSVVYLITDTGAATFVDPLNDLAHLSNRSANWFIDSSNPLNVANDTGRASRAVDDSEFLVYKRNNLSSAVCRLWTMTPASILPKIVSLFISTNGGKSFQSAPFSIVTTGAGSGGWSFYDLALTNVLPGGVNAFKIQLTSGSGNFWDPQIGSVTLMQK